MIIENDLDFPISNLITSHNLVNPQDYMKVCLKYGFWLYKIESMLDLRNLALLSLT